MMNFPYTVCTGSEPVFVIELEQVARIEEPHPILEKLTKIPPGKCAYVNAGAKIQFIEDAPNEGRPIIRPVGTCPLCHGEITVDTYPVDDAHWFCFRCEPCSAYWSAGANLFEAATRWYQELESGASLRSHSNLRAMQAAGITPIYQRPNLSIATRKLKKEFPDKLLRKTKTDIHRVISNAAETTWRTLTLDGVECLRIASFIAWRDELKRKWIVEFTIDQIGNPPTGISKNCAGSLESMIADGWEQEMEPFRYARPTSRGDLLRAARLTDEFIKAHTPGVATIHNDNEHEYIRRFSDFNFTLPSPGPKGETLKVTSTSNHMIAEGVPLENGSSLEWISDGSRWNRVETFNFGPKKKMYQLQPKTSAARCVAVGATIGNILGFSTDVFLAHEPWPRIERIGAAALSLSLIAYAVARLIDWRNSHRRQLA